MIGLILICHGDLARTLVETAEEIVGPIEGVCAISNRGKSPNLVAEEFVEAVRSLRHADGIIVMVDLFGSSCWRCGVTNARKIDGIEIPMALISGINLGTLLSFSQKRDILPFDALAYAMRTDAERGIDGPTFLSQRAPQSGDAPRREAS